MIATADVLVFGEVLFDCFPSGERVLGGAPFNVAWHLQALGNQPHFISRVGKDELGDQILKAMDDWNMDTASVQIDPLHSTGRVEVHVKDNEPHYDITPDVAYDFIGADEIGNLPDHGILYHGSLALRHGVSREALRELTRKSELSIFLDVNLRSPWWKLEEVHDWIEQARWVKLNEDELKQLGFDDTDIEQAMRNLQSRFRLDQLIVTQGSAGATVLTDSGEFHHLSPEPVERFIDTVGAGDAFTAVYIHGLMSSWTITETLSLAQRFASAVIGLRGAITKDPTFYRPYIGSMNSS